jgi:CRP-like cAMP-binding protein
MDLGLSLNFVVNVAFALGVVAFLLRDILYLRAVAMLAHGAFIYVALRHPAWSNAPHLYWYVAFFCINGVQSAILFYERRLQRFSPEEDALRELAFSALDPTAVRRILRRGTWTDLAPGDVLAREGEVPDYVVMLAEGTADVTLRDRPVAKVKPGEFVGEIAFLAGRPATATVRASEAGRAMVWSRARLHRLVNRDRDMHAAMYAAMGLDLAEKIAAASVAIAGPEPAAG